MSDFVAAFLVLVALAAVGNFASNGDAFGNGCIGNSESWVRVCR